MRTTFITIGFFGVILRSFIANDAQGTTFYPQPFSESVQAAPVIVRGKVGISYTDWSKDIRGTKRIYTFYELQPTEVFKGEIPSSSITIREMGGEKDGIGLTVPGVSQFEKGEDTLVLLADKNENGSYDVQGMMMGKFGISQDPEAGEYLTGMGLNNSTGIKTRWTLAALRDLIKEQSNNLAQSTPTPKRKTQLEPKKLTSDPSVRAKMPSIASSSPITIPSDLDNPDTRPQFNWLWGIPLILLSILILLIARRKK